MGTAAQADKAEHRVGTAGPLDTAGQGTRVLEEGSLDNAADSRRLPFQGTQLGNTGRVAVVAAVGIHFAVAVGTRGSRTELAALGKGDAVIRHYSLPSTWGSGATVRTEKDNTVRVGCVAHRDERETARVACEGSAFGYEKESVCACRLESTPSGRRPKFTSGQG